MNDGMISLVLMIIFMFIFIGGWLTDELKEANWQADRLLLYFVILMLAPHIHFVIHGLRFSILLILIPLMIVYLLISLSNKEIIQSLLGALFVAAVFNLLKEVLALDPILLVFEERLLFGLILGILIGLLSVSLKIKWIVATLGIWLGLCYFIIKHDALLTKLLLFSYYDLDVLFNLYLCVTITHLFILQSSQWIKKSINQH